MGAKEVIENVYHVTQKDAEKYACRHRYGYQRFETSVMVGVIVVLIALVALIQAGGDRLARWVDHR